eukprot:4109658-Ditylum_brightwellii.AAC.1
MKQVAFEHGFGDLENLQLNNKYGPKDDDEETTLLHRMATRTSHNNGLDVTLDCLPKCHPKIYSEGIEYV